MYNVLGTMIILPVTLYSIQGLMYSVPGTSYIMLGTVYSDQAKFKMYLVQCSALHAAIGFAGLPKLVTSVSSLQFSTVPVQ